MAPQEQESKTSLATGMTFIPSLYLLRPFILKVIEAKEEEISNILMGNSRKMAPTISDLNS